MNHEAESPIQERHGEHLHQIAIVRKINIDCIEHYLEDIIDMD